MEEMSFMIDGREYKRYELSDKQLCDLLKGVNLSDKERAFLMHDVLMRFEYQLCPREGEGNSEVFARLFSDFVNGKMYDYEKAAAVMAKDHRYLQQEMFKVCMAYIKKLAESYEKGWFDPRNEYACQTSSKMLESLRKMDWPY